MKFENNNGNFAEQHRGITILLRLALTSVVITFAQIPLIIWLVLVGLMVFRYIFVSKEDQERLNGRVIPVNCAFLGIANFIAILIACYCPIHFDLFLLLFLFSAIYFVFFDTEFILPYLMKHFAKKDEEE